MTKGYSTMLRLEDSFSVSCMSFFSCANIMHKMLVLLRPLPARSYGECLPGGLRRSQISQIYKKIQLSLPQVSSGIVGNNMSFVWNACGWLGMGRMRRRQRRRLEGRLPNSRILADPHYGLTEWGNPCLQRASWSTMMLI